MLEAPEALYLSKQVNQTIKDKVITDVIVAYTPHKFAFYSGSPDEYAEWMLHKRVCEVVARGGMIDVLLSADTHLIFSDGVNLRYYGPGEKLPAKHQLLIGFEDQSCIIASIRMYGLLHCFTSTDPGQPHFTYYTMARDKKQVMSDDFTHAYFLALVNHETAQKKTAKALLATEQTIPGLGNGVLQDILYNARIHPKRRVHTFTDKEKNALFDSIKKTLQEIFALQGRNTETDLFGVKGKYVPFLSKDTAGHTCIRCGEIIRKENYLGGSIYYCSGCQEIEPT